MDQSRNGDKVVEQGKIKGTSAFNIKQNNRVEEISWSNNKFESTYSCNDDKTKEQ